MYLISENEFTPFKHNNEHITYEIYKNLYDKINDRVINKKVNKSTINKQNKLKKLEEKRLDEENRLILDIIHDMNDF